MEQSGRSFTLLVVEDEPFLRLDLADVAQRAGFETLEAANSADAIEILEGRRDVQVLLTDIRMPGEIDGLALAHLVRDRWPPTIIVICSGNESPGELPAHAIFLSKPCIASDVESLLSTIRSEL